MSRAADLLRSLAGREWTDEDGERSVLTLLPPLSAAEIDALAVEWGAPVPADARELLRVARGIEDSPLESVEFAGWPSGVVEEELFPHAVPIAHDGSGDYWIVDLTPGSDVFGPVYFLAHEVSGVLYQCADVAEFLEALVEMAEPPHRGPLDFVSEQAVRALSDGREAGIPRAEALASGDAVLSDFAATLPDDAVVVDMRSPRMGEGFRLARGRAFIRHPPERLFAWHTPPRAPSPLAGWIKRLFGG